MGISRSAKNHLEQLIETRKLSGALGEVVPGTREYIKLLLPGLKKCYPRGYAFIIAKEGLTEEKMIDVYVNQNYLFIVWLKMMMWCDEYLIADITSSRQTT